jgi:hypothetical protein
MMRLLLAAVAALALAPTASAWTTIGSGVSNSADPAVLPGPLVAYSTGSSLVVGNGDSMKTLLAGQPFVGDPRLVKVPNGDVLLYVGIAAGVVHYTSADGGATWSGPSAPLPSSRVDDVQGAAVAPDGSVYVSQDGTDFIDVWHGSSRTNVFPYCCGYAESLAVDSNGLAQIAFWSNATGYDGYVYGPLGGPYVITSGGGDTAQHTDRVPLVADGSGNTFLAWALGYPTPKTLYVTTYRGGSMAHQVALGGGFSGADPHMALTVDSRSRLWAVWTAGGRVHAAQSCSAGAHFGRQTTVGAPGTVYAIEIAAAGDAMNAFVNTGSAIQAQVLLAGLTVKATRKAATVLNDSCPVAGALLRGGGHRVHTNGHGKASLKAFKRHTLVHVTAPGYAVATFRVP